MDDDKNRIRSFVRHQGRMTKGQRRALDTLWEHYGLDLSNQPINLQDVFGRMAPCVLEIGFGMGASLLHMAEQDSGTDFIGVDVYRPGVGALLSQLEHSAAQNLRVFCGDAVEVLEKAIPDHALNRVQIFFPDPWPKKRHHKRRLIQPEFLALVANKLVSGGLFHLATDWQPYAEHMMAVMMASPYFVNTAGEGYAPRPDYRPVTKFEQMGVQKGHQIWDLVFASL